MSVAAPRGLSSAMSMSPISDSLASSIAFSAVPPMPMPSMPGGHQPAPILGSFSSTQSTTLSDGLSIANLDLFSEPPPLAATVTSTVFAGHHLDFDDGRRVVLGVHAPEDRRRDDRGAQPVLGEEIGAAHALVDHLLKRRVVDSSWQC